MKLRCQSSQFNCFPAEGKVNDPLNRTNQHELLLVLFRVISWIVLSPALEEAARIRLLLLN